MSITIRPASREHDLDALLKLQAEAFPWTHESENPLTWDNLSTFVLEDNQIISSVMVGMDSEANHCILYGLMTHPDHRRKGYAEHLMQAVINNVCNDLPIYLCVLGTNEPAQELYLKLGFQFTGEVRNGNELVMRLEPEHEREEC